MPTVVTRDQTAMRRRIRWKLKLSSQPNQTTTITTKHRRTWRVISCIGILQKIDNDGYPLVDENGSTLVPVQREGPLDEDEASSLTAWAQGYREVRKNLRDSVLGRGYYKPESSRFKKVVLKTVFEKKPPRRDRIIRTPFRDKARDHSTERVTVVPLQTTWTFGERVSESSTEGHSPICSQNFLFARRCLCTVAKFVVLHVV